MDLAYVTYTTDSEREATYQMIKTQVKVPIFLKAFITNEEGETKKWCIIDTTTEAQANQIKPNISDHILKLIKLIFIRLQARQKKFIH